MDTQGAAGDRSGRPALDNRSVESTDEFIAELVRNSFGGDPASVASTAPVILPNKEDLTVRLVTQHSLDRMKDAESDRALLDSTIWCLIGGIVGFATNVVTGGQGVSAAGWQFVTMLVVAAICVALMRMRVNRRLKKARKRVSNDWSS